MVVEMSSNCNQCSHGGYVSVQDKNSDSQSLNPNFTNQFIEGNQEKTYTPTYNAECDCNVVPEGRCFPGETTTNNNSNVPLPSTNSEHLNPSAEQNKDISMPEHSSIAYYPGQISDESATKTDVLGVSPYPPGYYCPCDSNHTSQKNTMEQMDQSGQPEQLRPVPLENPPSYLPQPGDEISAAGKSAASGKPDVMGPIGPWATGRTDWGPLAGLTGTRPVVDKYSITRYSEGEWRQRNADLLKRTNSEQEHANLTEFNGKKCIELTRVESDKNQTENTKRLRQRANDVHRWKCELERAITAAAEEINLLESERYRLKKAYSVLLKVDSVVTECLVCRTNRIEPDLARDEVEEELVKEAALIFEIGELLKKLIADSDHRLTENKDAKQKIEFDWSDKKTTHELDSLNIGLNYRSNIVLYKPGATRFTENQSSPEHWEHFTRESLSFGEAARQRSVLFRQTIDSILTNAARDLRTQGDKVDMSLARRIACMDEMRQILENELKKTLQKIVDIEKIIFDIKAHIRRLDMTLKIAQTRLDNRLERPRVESCRDIPQLGLVDEVKCINDEVTALRSQLNEAENSRLNLNTLRADLEREIMIKRKSLELDRDRCQVIRTHYPSTTELIGHN